MASNATVDVSAVVDQGKIGRFQIGLFALCAASLIMDGFDVQAMAYVAPEVIRELGLSGAQLGNVLAAANFGLLCGALLFTVVADRIGRRPVLILGTFLYAVLTLWVTRADTLGELVLLRFLGGIGMGSIIPNATALIGEYSPRRHRITLIMTITVGFTAGAALGGFIAAWLMPLYGWRAVFYFGGTVPLVIGVLMVLKLPESLQFLVTRNRPEAVRRWLQRAAPSLSLRPGTRYVATEQAGSGVPVVQLLTDGRAPVTLLYWLVNFTNLLNLYFLAGLLPTVLTQSGISSSTSALITGMMQVGGTVGTFGLAWLIARNGFTPMLTITFALASLAIASIGSEPVLAAFPLLTSIVFVAGWCVIGAQPGLNALAATYYPTSMRSSGIGWGLGVGRLGAIVGPLIGGRLLDLEWSAQQLFLVFALPAVGSALAMLALHFLLAAGRRASAARQASATI